MEIFAFLETCNGSKIEKKNFEQATIHTRGGKQARGNGHARLGRGELLQAHARAWPDW